MSTTPSNTLPPKTDAYLRLNTVLEMLRSELIDAIQKHPPMHSPHEGYAVIREELEELWEHVKRDTGRSNEALKEALQIAAMGVRYAVDMSARAACAACDRGDFQLGHSDNCPNG